jgi:hypothetical protein
MVSPALNLAKDGKEVRCLVKGKVCDAHEPNEISPLTILITQSQNACTSSSWRAAPLLRERE